MIPSNEIQEKYRYRPKDLAGKRVSQGLTAAESGPEGPGGGALHAKGTGNT